MSAETIPCPVRTNAERRPTAPALIASEKTWSWAELDASVSGMVKHLDGLAPRGSCVAVQMLNSPELIALILAALRTGHILAPISTRLPGQAAVQVTNQIGAVAWLDEDGGRRMEERVSADESRISERSSTRIPLSRSATIIQTSGSTGAPKAALHTVGNHAWSARGLAEVIALKPEARWLLNLPLCHVGGLAIVYRCALFGATLVLPDPGMTTGEAIQTFAVTHASLVTTQLVRLLREENVALESLKAVLLGGSAASQDMVNAASACGLPVHMSYGLTEMASTVTVASSGDLARDGSTSGRVLPHRELAIRHGEIHVRGRTLFAGYVEGDRLVQPVDEDGWFATGDLGFLDETGCLHVTGRKDNRFVSGGESIQPEEIERVLEALPDVIQAVVVPVADDEFGRRPVAFVRIEGELDRQAMRCSLEATLPRFKLPVEFYPWPEIDGTKPNRTLLQEEAERLLAI